MFGAFGIIFQILFQDSESAAYGLAAFAFSASMRAANTLLGGSRSHIRFVTSQLGLERLIARKRIQWLSFAADLPAGAARDREQIKARFDFINGYMSEVHDLSIGQTQQRGEQLLKALEGCAIRIKQQQDGSSDGGSLAGRGPKSGNGSRQSSEVSQ